MASLIQCDRCKDLYPQDRGDMKRVSIGTRPANLGDAINQLGKLSNYDLCARCFIDVKRFLEEAPPHATSA